MIRNAQDAKDIATQYKLKYILLMIEALAEKGHTKLEVTGMPSDVMQKLRQMDFVVDNYVIKW